MYIIIWLTQSLGISGIEVIDVVKVENRLQYTRYTFIYPYC